MITPRYAQKYQYNINFTATCAQCECDHLNTPETFYYCIASVAFGMRKKRHRFNLSTRWHLTCDTIFKNCERVVD